MSNAKPQHSVPIDLALQGGGSHGALAWGVIDRLLEEPRLKFTELSGTSAGAMNAVALASGFAQNGAQGARDALSRFWKAVSDAARFSPVRTMPWDRMRGNYSLDQSPGYLMMEGLSRMFSPYELNPLDINPLRDLIDEQIDFEAINRCRDIVVHVTATNVRTGQPRTFSTGEISRDAVLASACLPQMYRAVEIDGEAYWDGGFSANPALYPLVTSTGSFDVLVVQLNPLQRHTVPRTARDIINRVNEISFNTSLIKELRALNVIQKLMQEGNAVSPNGGDVRIHMIHGEEDVQDLPASSKLNAEWSYLQHLFERGRRWADHWLENHLDDVGVRSSFKLEELFETHSRPPGMAPIESES